MCSHIQQKKMLPSGEAFSFVMYVCIGATIAIWLIHIQNRNITV